MIGSWLLLLWHQLHPRGSTPAPVLGCPVLAATPRATAVLNASARGLSLTATPHDAPVLTARANACRIRATPRC